MASQSEIANLKSKIAGPRLRPPQFGLRTLLLGMTLLGVMLGLVRLEWLSPVGLAMLIFLLLSVCAHVAGNCLGTRLRELGDRPEPVPDATQPCVIAPRPHDFAPATKLSRRENLGWLVIVAASIGATSGAIGGGFWTFLASRGQVGLLNITVGVIAFAILGGLAAFAVFGFAQVVLGAIGQALNGTAAGQPADPVD